MDRLGRVFLVALFEGICLGIAIGLFLAAFII